MGIIVLLNLDDKVVERAKIITQRATASSDVRPWRRIDNLCQVER